MKNKFNSRQAIDEAEEFLEWEAYTNIGYICYENDMEDYHRAEFEKSLIPEEMHREAKYFDNGDIMYFT